MSDQTLLSAPQSESAVDYEAIIVGGGPAGCGCGLWLHRLGVRALLLEGAARFGGLQGRSPYENLWIPGVSGRTGVQVADALHRQMLEAGVPHRLMSPVTGLRRTEGGFDVITADKAGHTQHLRTLHLILATGTRPVAGPYRATDNVAIGPGYPMEKLEVRNRKIAILGGGDNAFDQARFVLQRGAASVSVFSRSAPRAQSLLQDQVPQATVHIGPYTVDQDALTINGEAFDGMGVMYGFEAALPEGLEFKNENGFIDVNRFGETRIACLWACGEVTDYWHPCVTTSAAHGIQVAKQVSRRLGYG